MGEKEKSTVSIQLSRFQIGVKTVFLAHTQLVWHTSYRRPTITYCFVIARAFTKDEHLNFAARTASAIGWSVCVKKGTELDI